MAYTTINIPVKLRDDIKAEAKKYGKKIGTSKFSQADYIAMTNAHCKECPILHPKTKE